MTLWMKGPEIGRRRPARLICENQLIARLRRRFKRMWLETPLSHWFTIPTAGRKCCSVDYPALPRQRGILISMTRRENGHDNSRDLRRENSPLDCSLRLLIFLKTIKPERIWPVAWESRQQAEHAVARYIAGFYYPSNGIHRSASETPSHSTERPGK